MRKRTILRIISTCILLTGLFNFCPVASLGGELLFDNFLIQAINTLALVLLVYLDFKEKEGIIGLIPAFILDIMYAYTMYGILTTGGVNEIFPGFLDIHPVLFFKGVTIFIINILSPCLFIKNKKTSS